MHAGDKATTYSNGATSRTLQHRGRANFAAFMRRIAATFSPTRVAVAGAATGGYGATFNYPRVRAYWPNAKGYLIDDSAPLLVGDAIAPALRTAWGASWGLFELTDATCAGCRTDLAAFYTALSTSFPNDRMALLSSLQDSVTRNYLSLGAMEYQNALQALASTVLGPTANFRSFFIAGVSHTMLIAGGNTVSGGLTLNAWLNAMVTDAAWSSAAP